MVLGFSNLICCFSNLISRRSDAGTSREGTVWSDYMRSIVPMRHVESTPSVMDALSGDTQPTPSVVDSYDTQLNCTKPVIDGGCMIQHDEHQLMHLTHLAQLPADLLLIICSSCSAADLLAASCVTKTLRAVIDDSPILWEKILVDRHSRIITAFFHGIVPQPSLHHSWKMHAFAFDREWLTLARAESGRILLRMRSDCAAQGSDYDFGVPPRRAHLLTLRMPWTEMAFPINVELFGLGLTFGIYDVTDFVALHPGADQILLDAAVEDDCTEGFDAANHTERARSILRRLAVPGLEAMTPLPPLARTRPNPLIRCAVAMLMWVRWVRSLPGLLCSFVRHHCALVWLWLACLLVHRLCTASGSSSRRLSAR